MAERDLEQALMDHLQRFLLELGHGFAFVGRQWHFEIDGDDFYVDLLFFNFVQNRFVVVELKVDKFQPAYTGQLGMYVAWIDANLRDHSAHAPTIGILLCANKNESVVRYSLAGSSTAMAVARCRRWRCGFSALRPARTSPIVLSLMPGCRASDVGDGEGLGCVEEDDVAYAVLFRSVGAHGVPGGDRNATIGLASLLDA